MSAEDKEKLEKEISAIRSFSFRDGFVWGVVSAIVLALAVNLIAMRWHP